MPRVRVFLILYVLAILIGGPLIYYRVTEKMARNFHVVERGVLYRSGQLPLAGFRRIVHDHGIRTVICLRDGDHDVDRDEEVFCRRWGITHVRIPPRSWSPKKGSPKNGSPKKEAPVKGPVPVEEGLTAFRRVMDDPANHPVLIHCFAGLHRTGAYCAVHRMEYQGWSNHDAIAEMRAIGYDTLDNDRDLLRFLTIYRARPQSVFRAVSRHAPPSPRGRGEFERVLAPRN
ncbi:MAG: tyrosine-protein phosphatase [Gemmataceae bacterium]|nr:tyrosine-protein phosphatase [Gemmataceae bacterium]